MFAASDIKIEGVAVQGSLQGASVAKIIYVNLPTLSVLYVVSDWEPFTEKKGNGVNNEHLVTQSNEPCNSSNFLFQSHDGFGYMEVNGKLERLVVLNKWTLSSSGCLCGAGVASQVGIVWFLLSTFQLKPIHLDASNFDLD